MLRCDWCAGRIQKDMGVVIWAVGSKKMQPKCPATQIKIVHNGRCHRLLEEHIFDGFVTVQGGAAVPCVAPTSRFRGDGDHVARLRQLYDFSQKDVLKLREIDAKVAAERALPSRTGLLSYFAALFRGVAQ